VQIGLMLSVTVSLLLVIAESVRPQMSMLWRLPGTQIYRNIKQESDGQFVPGIICIRIGASMCAHGRTTAPLRLPLHHHHHHHHHRREPP
jgi:hypothetical protein